jgi:hypothetical protein
VSNCQVSKEHCESWGLVEIGLKNITIMIKNNEDEMGRAHNMHGREVYAKFRQENFKERDH